MKTLTTLYLEQGILSEYRKRAKIVKKSQSYLLRQAVENYLNDEGYAKLINRLAEQEGIIQQMREKIRSIGKLVRIPDRIEESELDELLVPEIKWAGEHKDFYNFIEGRYEGFIRHHGNVVSFDNFSQRIKEAVNDGKN